MYYPDLTTYSYSKGQRSPNALNVGWLDIQHPFPRRKASKELLDALFERCLHSEVQTRGWHRCEFCREHEIPLKVFRLGEETTLGSAEITINGKDGKQYAAPTLIYHYVAAHDYAPSAEFVEALLASSPSRLGR